MKPDTTSAPQGQTAALRSGDLFGSVNPALFMGRKWRWRHKMYAPVQMVYGTLQHHVMACSANTAWELFCHATGKHREQLEAEGYRVKAINIDPGFSVPNNGDDRRKPKKDGSMNGEKTHDNVTAVSVRSGAWLALFSSTMKNKTDTELMDLVNKNEAWVTYASDEAGTKRAWRCVVSERRFASPDIRERSARKGFGRTARAAIKACFG